MTVTPLEWDQDCSLKIREPEVPAPWFLDPGGQSKTAAVSLYFIFPGICTLSLEFKTFFACMMNDIILEIYDLPKSYLACTLLAFTLIIHTAFEYWLTNKKKDGSLLGLMHKKILSLESANRDLQNRLLNLESANLMQELQSINNKCIVKIGFVDNKYEYLMDRTLTLQSEVVTTQTLCKEERLSLIDKIRSLESCVSEEHNRWYDSMKNLESQREDVILEWIFLPRKPNKKLKTYIEKISDLIHKGGNAMVLKTGEEGGNTGLVQSKKSQGELGQGEFAPSKPDQEELPQSSLAQEATGRVEEREHKEEEMGGGCAGDDSSGPVNKGIHGEGDHCVSVQQQPEQEAAIPEGTKSLQTGDRLPFQPRTRFTQSQLQDLENLFEETPYPSLRARKDLARWMGVPEDDVLRLGNLRFGMMRNSPFSQGSCANYAKAQIVLLHGEGRKEKGGGQGQPGQARAAAEVEGAGELSREGPSPAEGEGLQDDWNQEGTSVSGQENEQRPQELVPKGMGVTKVVQPVPVLISCVRLRDKFMRIQLQEMECLFQRNHYLSTKEGNPPEQISLPSHGRERSGRGENRSGGNAMVLETGEEGGKAGLRSKLAQHELDQGKFALGELAPSKPDQEELAQSSFAQEATGMVEEREKKEEEMGGGHAGHGSSGPVDKGIHEEGDHGVSVQQEPEQEAAMPEGTKSLQAGDRLPFHHRTRLTQSQLQDLENLFEGIPYPSLGTRIGLKTGEPVQGEAENVDAVRCTTWSPEQGSLKILEQH
ncbi:hypothetical protein STEG23_026661 [Scotinomys teguina]